MQPPVSVIDQLEEALGLAPPLAGAHCRGRSDLFDLAEAGADHDDVAYAEQAAIRLCDSCPVLDRCSAWFDALTPSRRPLGVIAGRVSVADGHTRKPKSPRATPKRNRRRKT